MVTDPQRRLFGDEPLRRRRRRRLVATIVAAGLGTGATLVLELAPTPEWLTIAAVALACLAIVLAGRAVALLGADDRLRVRRAEEAVDLMGSTVLVIDRGSRIRLANPAACAVLGRSEPELLGQTLQEAIFAEADREASHRAFAQMLDGRLDPRGHRSTREVVRPDGTSRTLSWHVAPRFDARGAVESLLISGEDVTEAREQEARRAQEREDLGQLAELARDIAASDDARQSVADRVRLLLGGAFAGLSEPVADGTGDWWYTTATDEIPIGHRLPADAPSGVLAVVRSAEPLFIEDAVRDERITRALVEQTGARSLLFHPVVQRGSVVAVITVGWTSGGVRLDEREQQLVGVAAQETAMALQRIAAVRQLQAAALTDVLTGVANRRAFDAELDRAIARARRSGEPLALAMLDLNAFKALNDQHGHHAGDAVLVACAEAWAGVLRGGDILARLGGDEFAVVLPGCELPSARSLVARLRAVTPHGGGAAIGLVGWQDEAPEQLCRAADRALYADKALSRGQRLASEARLAAVHASAPWAQGPTPELNALAAEAAEAMGGTSVYITLVGEDELRYAGKPGDDPDDGRALPRAYCQHVVETGRPFVVFDAACDPTVAGSAAAAGGLLAYAGSPITDAGGHVLGAVCACAPDAREWSKDDLDTLDRFAMRAGGCVTTGAER